MDNKVEMIHRKPIPVFITLIIAFCLIGAVLSGCTSNSNNKTADSEGKINIVTTTTMLYDLAVSIGGDQVSVTALMGPGIDPHLYQASAGDVTKMQDADIIVYNGLHLEGKMGDIFASLSGSISIKRTVMCLATSFQIETLNQICGS